MTRLSAALAAAAALCLVAGAHSSARADGYTLNWMSQGYYRTRGVFLTNLAPEDRYRIASEPSTNQDIIAPEIRRTSYMVQRLRTVTTLRVDKAGRSEADLEKDPLPLAMLHVQVDALDDVLWGENNGLASAPLFSLEVSDQHFLGGPQQPSVRIPRAWVQFKVPIGIMRVGRMSSHWGLGILANGGGSFNYDPMSPPGKPKRKDPDTFFDDDFGDNHFGATTDRALFITRPLTIAKTIMGRRNVKSNLLVGYAYDKLAEAPFFPAEPTERKFRPFGQQGFISRGRNDDVNEHVVLAIYNDTEINKLADTDQLTVGVYGVLRTSKEGTTNPSDPVLGDPTRDCGGELVPDPMNPVPCIDTGSNVWIADLWWKLRLGPYYTEGEVVYIGGQSFGGVPFPSKNKLKKASILGGVARFGYLTKLWDGILEIGHAGGDTDIGDGTFSQRALNPDYNVGLILFEEILREQTARAFLTFISNENPQGAQGLMSNGGVINANYLHPKVRWRPALAGMAPGQVTLIGALLMAWVDTLPVGGVTTLFTPAADEGRGSYLGTELDLALKVNFSGHMTFSLETGYLQFGDALKARLPNASSSFTLQSRLAFVW